MPLTPEEIRNQKFAVALRGYEKDDVDDFLVRVAADYEAAIAAIASAGDPYASLGREVGAVLRSAKESAESMRVQAEEEAKLVRQKSAEEAIEARRHAAEEAASTLEGAREKAMRLSQEAERILRNAQEEAAIARAEATEETAEMRRQTTEEATARLDAAAAEAQRLTEEAQRHARELREAAERQCEELLRDATQRHQHLGGLERELEERVEAVEDALTRLRAELGRTHEAAEDVGSAASTQVPSDRLKGLDPDLDQVAGALTDDVSEAEEARRSVEVQGPQQRRSSKKPVRGKSE